MVTNQSSSSVKRYVELDALRGVAAVVVMLHHFFRLWTGTPHARWTERLFTATPLRLLVAGRASVVLFFLLSGFVLSLPRLRGTERSYGPYLVKRVCRIYLPYLVALGLAVLGCARWHGATEFGGWFSLTWYQPPTLRLVVQHVLFLGDYHNTAYNTAFWSLIQEMRISLVFPALFLLVRRLPLRWALVLSPALMVLTSVGQQKTTIPEQVLWTVNYTGAFVYGILLARYKDALEQGLTGLSKRGYALFAMASLLLFMIPDRAGQMMPGLGAPAVDLVMMWGGAGLILIALSHRAVLRVLRSRALEKLGRCSYSVYLLHGTVLFTLVYLFGQKVGVLPLLLPYFVITLACGWGMYWAVEVPSMHLGRQLARALDSRPAASAGTPVNAGSRT